MGLLSRRHEGEKKKEDWRLDKMGNDNLSNIISGTQWEKKYFEYYLLLYLSNMKKKNEYKKLEVVYTFSYSIFLGQDHYDH